jgi:hypothetical protein
MKHVRAISPNNRRAGWPLVLFLVLALGVAADRAAAQVSSESKGTVTLMVGEASAPIGGIPNQVASPGGPTPQSTQHAKGFRLAAGYNFAKFLSAEFALSYFGQYNRSVPYAAGDTLEAQSAIVAIEGDLVGRLPIAPFARVNLSLGIAETGLHTTLSTIFGTALPGNIPADENVRRFGPAGGAELEFRLSERSSLLVGYHGYAHVGSSRLAGSAAGRVGAILAGAHFEF